MNCLADRSVSQVYCIPSFAVEDVSPGLQGLESGAEFFTPTTNKIWKQLRVHCPKIPTSTEIVPHRRTNVPPAGNGALGSRVLLVLDSGTIPDSGFTAPNAVGGSRNSVDLGRISVGGIHS